MLAQLTTAKRQLIVFAFFDLRDITPWYESTFHNLPWTPTGVETDPWNQFPIATTPAYHCHPPSAHIIDVIKCTPKTATQISIRTIDSRGCGMFLKSMPRICQRIQLANTCTLKLIWHQWVPIHVGTTHNCEAPTNCVRILWSSRSHHAMIWIDFPQPSMNSHWRGNWPLKPIQTHSQSNRLRYIKLFAFGGVDTLIRIRTG